MTASESAEASPPEHKRDPVVALRQWLGSLARWQKISLAVASLLLVLGLIALWIEGPARSPSTPDSASTQVEGGSPAQWVPGPGQPGSPKAGSPKAGDPGAGADPWSAGFFRLGFSFFAGFSIGMALRSFLKLAVIGSGIALLFLLLLSYGELITVNWTAIDALFENLGKRISMESGHFQSFITGSLPSTGLAALGLSTALRHSRR